MIPTSDIINAAGPTSEVEFLEWDSFIARFVWNQGEHVGLIGPTGGGKTTMALALLPLRTYVTVLGTKPQDATLSQFAKHHDYKVLQKWNSRLSVHKYPRRVLWPPARSLYSQANQIAAFKPALEEMYLAGRWCIYADELWYIIQQLGMSKEIKTFLLQSRSMLICLMMAFQRPAWVPVEVYDQCTHLFFWRENDETNLSRIGGIAYTSAELVRRVVSQLRHHEVLYINTRDGSMVRTMSPPPQEVTA